MANRRMIYQDFFEDDYFGTVEIGLRLFWVGLITAVADDQGRILDNSALIRAKVFMYDPNISTKQIDDWLHKLNADNKIVRYQADSKDLIQIINWWTYQTPAWASHSKYLPPEGWTDRIRCHVAGPKQGGNVETINWEQAGGFVSKQENKLPSKLGSYQASGIDDVKLSKDNGERSFLLELFEKKTQIIQPSDMVDPSGFISWEKEIKKWEDMDATKADVISAIEKADELKSNLSWPGSITKYMRSAVARRKRGVSNDKPTNPNTPDPYPEFGIVYDENGVAYNAKGEVVNV